MIGLAQGQTAQLNLLNPGIQAPAVGAICTATVSFFDSADVLLKTANVAVAPSRSSSVSLSSVADLSIVAGTRREIRAQVTIPGLVPVTSAAASAVGSSCKLVPSLEVYDSSNGRTQVNLGRMVQIPAIVAASPGANN